MSERIQYDFARRRSAAAAAATASEAGRRISGGVGMMM